MCGIAQFTHEDRCVYTDLIEGATSSQIHRGPDRQGVYESPHVSLGAVKLTIIDLVSGEQPMRSEDGDTVLVCNGEVYDHAEPCAESRCSAIAFSLGTEGLQPRRRQREIGFLLRESVKEHVLADVPLGLWANGVRDLSTILHYAAETSSKPLKIFSITSRGRSFDRSGSRNLP